MDKGDVEPQATPRPALGNEPKEVLENLLLGELQGLFEDSINTGFYINTYTTKVNPNSSEFMGLLRRLAARFVEEQDAKSNAGEASSSPLKQGLAILRKLAYMSERLSLKSGSEMIFPMLFGHMSFSSHRCWDISLKYPVSQCLRSWESAFNITLFQRPCGEDLERADFVTAASQLKLPHGWTQARQDIGNIVYVSPEGVHYRTFAEAYMAAMGPAEQARKLGYVLFFALSSLLFLAPCASRPQESLKPAVISNLLVPDEGRTGTATSSTQDPHMPASSPTVVSLFCSQDAVQPPVDHAEDAVEWKLQSTSAALGLAHAEGGRQSFLPRSV
jgi:hypothetical protein